MKILPILICGLIVAFLYCSKEKSCQGPDCLQWPASPTPDTIRTTPNDLITSCDIFIEMENEVRKIYVEQRNKLHSRTYIIFDSILMDGSKRYIRSYDLKNYIDLSKYVLNDTFFVRYEIRWRFSPAEFVHEDTLVY